MRERRRSLLIQPSQLYFIYTKNASSLFHFHRCLSHYWCPACTSGRFILPTCTHKTRQTRVRRHRTTGNDAKSPRPRPASAVSRTSRSTWLFLSSPLFRGTRRISVDYRAGQSGAGAREEEGRKRGRGGEELKWNDEDGEELKTKGQGGNRGRGRGKGRGKEEAVDRR